MTPATNRCFPVPAVAGLLCFQSALGGVHQPVNSYYFEGENGPLLIDPALDLTPELLPKTPVAILITHLQEEHIAGAANFPDVPLYVPLGSEYLCEGHEAYWNTDTTWQAPWEWETRGNYQGHLAGARNERAPKTKLPVAGTVKAGEEVFGLQVLATPGHGKNALTYLATVNGTKLAFCGDLVYGSGQAWNWFDCDWDYGLQNGQRALLQSAQALQAQQCDLLLPSHGQPIDDAAVVLGNYQERLQKALAPGTDPSRPVNFEEKDAPEKTKYGSGWREISPSLFQWRDGNAALLLSRSGNALLVDDGLCYWDPVDKRAPYHRMVMRSIKEALNIDQITLVIPTHYHGDHIEYIPQLVEEEGARVLCLSEICEAIEFSERFNLASPLPWYGASHKTIPIHHRANSGLTMKWHEYTLELFHLGGQTYYHAGIKAQVDGKTVLFVGDAISGWHLDPEPILCYNDCEPETRGWAYSVDRMIEHQPDVLVCGHGSSIKEPMPLLLEKRERWRQRIQDYAELNPRPNSRLFFDPFYTEEPAASP